MRPALKAVFVVALFGVLTLAFGSADAQAQKKKKKKADQPVTGVVVSVDDQGGGKGTITIKVQPKKKKNDPNPPPAKEEKIKFDDTTKFEVAGKKKAPATAGALADVKTDAQVTITVKDNVAQRVLVQQKKKKKNT